MSETRRLTLPHPSGEAPGLALRVALDRAPGGCALTVEVTREGAAGTLATHRATAGSWTEAIDSIEASLRAAATAAALGGDRVAEDVAACFARAMRDEPPRDEAGAHGRPDGGDRVLVVDDNDVVRELTQLLLETAGFEVESVPDAESAMAACGGRAFSVAVVDLNLGGTGGLELRSRRREAAPATRVLIVSGSLERLSEECEPHATLAKPFSREQLVGAVRGLLARPPC